MKYFGIRVFAGRCSLSLAISRRFPFADLLGRALRRAARFVELNGSQELHEFRRIFLASISDCNEIAIITARQRGEASRVKRGRSLFFFYVKSRLCG